MVTGITGGGHLRGAPWTAEFLTHYLDIYIYIYISPRVRARTNTKTIGFRRTITSRARTDRGGTKRSIKLGLRCSMEGLRR
jgi:hypothetical protein